ncbi:hypothetical protein LXL04_023118 [Taraxacum kok-saghyz]
MEDSTVKEERVGIGGGGGSECLGVDLFEVRHGAHTGGGGGGGGGGGDGRRRVVDGDLLTLVAMAEGPATQRSWDSERGEMEGEIERPGQVSWRPEIASLSSTPIFTTLVQARLKPTTSDGSGRYRPRRQDNHVTFEHYYRADVFLYILDKQLQELNNKFSDLAMEFITQVCTSLEETKKSETYHLLSRLIRLLLTPPVSTATTERGFSAMK